MVILPRVKNTGETIMFHNLETEQARHGYTDGRVAKRLNISEQEYMLRKKSGLFLESDAKNLITLYNKSFEYLFEPEYGS